MKILIFSVTGMLGHAIWLKLRQAHQTFGTVRRAKEELKNYKVLYEDSNNKIIDKVDVTDSYAIDKALDIAEPKVVINCIGIIKQLPESKDPIIAININSLFPHILAKKCRERGIWLIHISTDCVFSGGKGLYAETDVSDAEDLYGRTKYLGEVSGPKCLTIRTSLIGRELSGTNGLLEWFLAQKGKQIKGYQKAILSGLTTYTLADIMQEIIEKHYTLEGLYHIGSEPIAKYDLLMKIKKKLSFNVEIVPDSSIVVDRSLDSTKFRKDTLISIPTWDEMAENLSQIIPDYEKWRF